jgi:nucleotide-binding universal stress UspA family protein
MVPIKNVLFFIEGETSATDAMRLAVARARSLDARLTFASVVAPSEPSLLGGRLSPKQLEQWSVEAEEERLGQLVDPCREPGVAIESRVLVGDPAAAIVRAVMADGYDMVWKPPGESERLRDRFIGSTDMRLIRACPRPVAIVGRHRPEEGRRVTVAAVDVASGPGREEVNDDLNDRVLQLALAGVPEAETRLHVVHAWTLYGETIMRSPRAQVNPEELNALLEKEHAARQAALEGLVERFRSGLTPSEAARFTPDLHLVKGDPATAIPGELERLGADLLVMGTISRRGLTGFLIGNAAEKILHQLSCSVLVTKPDGFVSPVAGT